MQPAGTRSGTPVVAPRGRSHQLFAVLAIAVVVTVAFACWFLLFRAPGNSSTAQEKPVVMFGTPRLSNGNATIDVLAFVPPMSPSLFELRLAVLSGGIAYISSAAMPTENGSWVLLYGNPGCCRVYWTDPNGSRNVTRSSVFTIAGIDARLPAATDFGFTLNWAYDGSQLEGASFATP